MEKYFPILDFFLFFLRICFCNSSSPTVIANEMFCPGCYINVWSTLPDQFTGSAGSVVGGLLLTLLDRWRAASLSDPVTSTCQRSLYGLWASLPCQASRKKWSCSANLLWATMIFPASGWHGAPLGGSRLWPSVAPFPFTVLSSHPPLLSAF